MCKKIISLMLFILIMNSCAKKEKKKEIINDKYQEMNIENVLKLQLLAGKSALFDETADGETYIFEEKDLEVTIPLLKSILKDSGFKFLSNELFIKKIKSIFGRTIDMSLTSKYLYITSWDKCNKELVFFTNENTVQINPTSYYVIKGDNFISELYAIPQILNYQKEYPKIANLENEINIDTIKNGTKVKLYLWREAEEEKEQSYNLKVQRNKNIQTLINRNKFLFNDSKASFAWLKFNDEYFLDDLVKTFGYFEDKELSKFVLDRSLKDNEEFGKVLWNKDCNGKLQFHKEILDIIASLTKEEQAKYFDKIVDYLEYLLIEKPAQEIHLDLTFSQKAEMLGKVAYFASKITGETGDYYFKFFSFLNSEAYHKEFEKQDYYKIQDFKEVYEYTRTGGIGLPM